MNWILVLQLCVLMCVATGCICGIIEAVKSNSSKSKKEADRAERFP